MSKDTPDVLTDDLCENLKDILEQTADLEAEYSKLKALPDKHSKFEGPAQSDSGNSTVTGASSKEEQSTDFGLSDQCSKNGRQKLNTCDEVNDCCGGTCQAEELTYEDSQKILDKSHQACLVNEDSPNDYKFSVDQIRERFEQLEKKYKSLTSTLTVK